MGDDDLMSRVAQLVQKSMAGQENHFLMQWNGEKTPLGAAIDGVPITWAQHGILYGGSGDDLGKYDRIVEYGSPRGEAQVMLIGTNGTEVRPPRGGSVEKVDPNLPPLMTGGAAEKSSKFPSGHNMGIS